MSTNVDAETILLVKVAPPTESWWTQPDFALRYAPIPAAVLERQQRSVVPAGMSSENRVVGSFFGKV